MNRTMMNTLIKTQMIPAKENKMKSKKNPRKIR